MIEFQFFNHYYQCLLIHIQIMEESDKSEFSQFKQKLFDFTKQLVSNQMSINLYILFIIIQNLQYIAYQNNGLLTFNTLGFSQFASAAKYINLAYYMQSYNVNVFLIPLFTVLAITHIIMLILGYKAYQQKIQQINRSIQDRNFHKNRLQYFINLLMICYNTFLTIPVFQTSVTAIYCTDTNPFTAIQGCYSGSQIIIMVMGIFNVLWLLLINVYYSFYYYSRNPFSNNFLTCSSNWWNLGKFIIKITPMIYFMYDPKIQFTALFLIMIIASYGGYLVVFRIIFPYYRYNFKLQKTIFVIEGFSFLLNCSFIIIYLRQQTQAQPNLILLSWTIMSFLLVLSILDHFVQKKKNLIMEIHSLDKNKVEQIQQFIVYLINQTQTSFSHSNATFFIANIAKTHQKECQDLHCYCRTFFKQAKKPNYYRNKALFYTLLLSIIDRIIKQNRKAYPFFILKAYILYYKMSSQIKAATTISIIMSDKLDFSNQMLVKGLLFELNQQYNDTRDMEVYRKFNEFLLQQEQQSLKLVSFYLQYWQELIDQKSSLPKMHILLKKIKTSKSDLHRIVEGALSIFRNHVRVLLLYKSFLKQVLNDYFGYIKCEQKYKVGLKENKLTNVDAVNTIQFRPNQNLLVINFTRHYSTHSQIMGSYQIISISSNVKQFLGFTNNQLKGQSINKLIPRIYHTVHDTFIDKILDKKDADIESRQIRIFPNNSNGHLIECNVISKFMPSITHGINIVSFLQQCDKYKDQFFIIYDGCTGMVDSMNAQAESMLKDGTRRKVNDMLAIPDHINDLLPNWDYKNQEWKVNAGRGKSMKSIPNMNQFKYQVKHIELVRSDGLQNKFIKVLKFKGDYFVRMFSIDNQSYKESNTIQQYLDYQKGTTEMYNKMDSAQLQEIIRVQTKKIIQRHNERKRTGNSAMKKTEKAGVIIIQEHPSEISRITFISIQWFLFFVALALTCYELIVSNINITIYNEDASLLSSINQIQTLLSDSVYITSLVATEEAYSNSNLTLPFDNYVSSIQMKPQFDEVVDKILEMNSILNQINPILIDKMDKGEIDQASLNIEARYLLLQGTKKYYIRKMNIIQSTYQFTQYCKDMVYRMMQLKQNILVILNSANFFYIFANSLTILPDTLFSLKQNILSSIRDKLDLGFTTFLIVKLLVTALIILSALTTTLYYRFIFTKYIWKVIEMYQNIHVQKIKIYQQKCNKYKQALNEKDQRNKQNRKSKMSMLSASSMADVDQIKMSQNQSQLSKDDQEQQKLMIVFDDLNNQVKEEVEQHFLNFQQIPTLKKLIFILLSWIMLYGILLFSLCYTYYQGTQTLQTQIINLNKYTLMQNSIIQVRLYSQLSLNMLNYWDQDFLNTVNQQLQRYFDQSLKLANDTTLDFTTIKPLFAAKYEQFRGLQRIVLSKNMYQLNLQASQIESQLQSIDQVLQVLQQLSASYLLTVEGQSQNISNKLNICISLSLIFILIFWFLGAKYNYHRLIEQHELAFEMYNIIGYNLRKELEKD